MNSDKLLEDLESLVMNASKVPFTNKKMVEEEEILQIIGLDSTMRYAMKKTDIEVVTFKDRHVELYWCDQVR